MCFLLRRRGKTVNYIPLDCCGKWEVICTPSWSRLVAPLTPLGILTVSVRKKSQKIWDGEGLEHTHFEVERMDFGSSDLMAEIILAKF